MSPSTILKIGFIATALAFAGFRISAYVATQFPIWQHAAQERENERKREAYAKKIASINETLRGCGVRLAVPAKSLDGFAFSLESVDASDANLDKIRVAFQPLGEAAPHVHTEIRLGANIDRRVLPVLAAVNRLRVVETNGAALSEDDINQLRAEHPDLVLTTSRTRYTYQ